MDTVKEITYNFPAIPGLSDIRHLIEAGEKHLSQGEGTFLIDMEKTTQFNSLAMGAVLKLHNQYRKKNRQVFLININDDAEDTLRSSGLICILNIKKHAANKIDLTGAAISLAVELDFEIYKEIGIFKFGGSMLTPGDSDLFYNMAKTIISDGYKMLIDMSNLVYIDSMGIGAIVRIHKLMEGNKGEIRICSPGDILKDIFESQNLSTLINLYDTRDQALKDWIH